MPIRVECESCHCKFQVADAAAGKAGHCPRCRNLLTIPGPRQVEAVPLLELDDEDDGGSYALDTPGNRRSSGVTIPGPRRKKANAPVVLTEDDQVTTATLTPKQILAAFQDYIQPVRPKAVYRMWVGLVAGFMLLLPVLYLGFIALVAYLVYYHLTQHTGLVDFSKGGSRHVKAFLFALYWVPALMGLSLVFFLFKPFFARSGGTGKSRSLDPSKEPLLFAFVDGVCQTVGSRTPSRIDVDCRVNASASYASGAFSLFNRDLVLTIGLPLVAGLDIKQFAGVLAHEFGHFSQKTGMRVSTMIRSVNMWFARVVYERDAWDDRIEQMCRSASNASLLGLVFKGAVWLSRRVLWCFMMAGHVISSVLLRQMEFDADRYEARMVGGDVFESTARKLHVLGAANQGAMIDLQNSWREGSLVDNLPKLIAANVTQIPEDVLEKIDDQVTKGTTKLFDTHPTDRERIHAAHAEDADGVFRLEGPASDVFRDFDSLCRASTFDYYKEIFGPRGVSRDQLKPVGDVVRTQVAAMKGNEALTRFYQGVFNPFRPFLLPEALPSAPSDAKATRENLLAARQKMDAEIARYEEDLKTWEDLRLEAVKVAAARAMIKAGYKPRATDFGLTRSDIDTAKQAASEIADDLERLDESLSLRESATIRRIHAALSLLYHAHVGEVVPDAASWREEVRDLYRVARHVGRNVIPPLLAAARGHRALVMVLELWIKHQDSEPLRNAVLRAGKTLSDSLHELRTMLGDSVAYPFDHQEGTVSLARYALPEVPDPKDIEGLLNVGGRAIDQVLPLHIRLVGRLMLAAEAVETALGLEPLPKRPEPIEEGLEAS